MATKKTKNTKNAPALRNAEPYKNSAGIKLPNADIIIEANAAGAVTSCRDVVTGEEYVGGGGGLEYIFPEQSITVTNDGAVIQVDESLASAENTYILKIDDSGYLQYYTMFYDSDEGFSTVDIGGITPHVTKDGNDWILYGIDNGSYSIAAVIGF